MNAQGHNWEDLRLLHCIVQGKGLSGASRLLGLHHSTVLRRLESLEHRTGVVLFHRSAQGYHPTEIGLELAAIAEQIEQHVAHAYRCLEVRDQRLSGTLRCATTDYIAQTILPPVLQLFQRRHPKVDIEIDISPQFASLAEGRTDIAIRATNNAPGAMAGRRVARIDFGIYGAKSYLDRQPEGAGPEQLSWISVDESLSHVAHNQWLNSDFPDAQVRTRFNSLLGQLGAVRDGMGIAFLPHFLTRSIQNLRCLEAYNEAWHLNLWLLTHPDRQHMPRLTSFLNCVEEQFSHVDFSVD